MLEWPYRMTFMIHDDDRHVLNFFLLCLFFLPDFLGLLLMMTIPIADTHACT